MPSNRSFIESRPSIEDISLLSKIYDAESILFDNSHDTKKAKFVEGNSSVSVYNKKSPINSSDNWRACISAATQKYILMVGDDDRVSFLTSPESILENLSDSYIGVRPLFIPFTKKTGVISAESFSTEGVTAKERLAQYFTNNGGKNLSFYSIYRKDIFVDLMQEFYDLHPTKAGYTDWSIVLALVSMGKISVNKNFIFYYCIDNWNSSELIESSNENIFKSAGLPVDALSIQSAFTALDSFALIARSKSNIPTGEKYDAAIFSLDIYYSGLIAALKSANNQIDCHKVRLALDLVDTDLPSDSQKIINLLTVIETWVPGLARKYQDYFAKIIDPVIMDALG
jgi:hypothetical protein